MNKERLDYIRRIKGQAKALVMDLEILADSIDWVTNEEDWLDALPGSTIASGSADSDEKRLAELQTAYDYVGEALNYLTDVESCLEDALATAPHTTI